MSTRTTDASSGFDDAPDSFDALARDLQALRLSHGAPSYSELALRIAEARAASGLSPEQSRIARSSVYDLFREGRKRINIAVFREVLCAIRQSAEEIAAWEARAIRLRDEQARASVRRSTESASTQAPAVLAPAASEAPTTPAAVMPAAPTANPTLLFSIVLCVAAVALNNALNFSGTALQLPLYLDMAGTALIAFAYGP